MRPALAVARRELAGYFATPVAYVFIVVFLVMSGVLTFTVGGFFIVAKLDRHTEHAHRQTELVVLSEVDQVRFRDLPALEDLGEREVRFVDVHSLPSAPIPV